MDRTAVEAYLNDEYPELIDEAGLTSLDAILDACETALANRPDVSVLWANALADYYLLKRARAAFAANMDIRTEDGDSYSLNQQFKNIDAMLSKAYAKVGWIVEPPVVDPATEGIGKVVTVSTSYLSPEGGW